MRKVATVLMLVFIFNSFAQMKVSSVEKPIEIGKVGPGLGTWYATLSKYNQTSSYLFRYKDTKYATLDEYKSFWISFEDFEPFYNLLIENLEKAPKEDVRVQFKDDVIYLKFKKALGMVTVEITHQEGVSGLGPIGFSYPFTKRQIMKLFGKKD